MKKKQLVNSFKNMLLNFLHSNYIVTVPQYNDFYLNKAVYRLINQMFVV